MDGLVTGHRYSNMSTPGAPCWRSRDPESKATLLVLLLRRRPADVEREEGTSTRTATRPVPSMPGPGGTLQRRTVCDNISDCVRRQNKDVVVRCGAVRSESERAGSGNENEDEIVNGRGHSSWDVFFGTSRWVHTHVPTTTISRGEETPVAGWRGTSLSRTVPSAHPKLAEQQHQKSAPYTYGEHRTTRPCFV